MGLGDDISEWDFNSLAPPIETILWTEPLFYCDHRQINTAVFFFIAIIINYLRSRRDVDHNHHHVLLLVEE